MKVTVTGISLKDRLVFYIFSTAQVSDNDFKALDDVVKGIVKEKQPFERLEMKKSDLLEMFKYNQFKVGEHNNFDKMCFYAIRTKSRY